MTNLSKLRMHLQTLAAIKLKVADFSAYSAYLDCERLLTELFIFENNIDKEIDNANKILSEIK